MTLPDETINGYLEAISARTPTPGGGSVAALAGTLGAALAQMAGRYTSGKKYAAVEAEARNLVGEAQERLVVLRRYIDEDCAAYDEVSAAMGLPKETEEQTAARAAAMQKAFRSAMAVPLSTCRECLKLLGSLRRLAEICNRNLVSDVGVAALLTLAALEGAKLNVETNLGAIRDEQLTADTRAEIAAAWAEAIELKNQIMAHVAAAISR